ncbi:MAG TPA: serine/threonine-protein kinase [Myxococcaceae bacterium]|nr:serine/threonine-protein kinase [Myxococcaceae bacterium]
MACLTENQLLDHAAGKLGPAEARAADEHLDGCVTCRAVLAALVDSEGEDEADSGRSGPGDSTAGERSSGGSGDDDDAPAEAWEGTLLVSGSPEDDLPRGTAFDRYVLLKKVGAGGMGVVYAAYDPRLDRTIAVKLLRSDVAATMTEEARARMLREAQAMARLSHPNVVAVHDAGTHEGRLYLAIEYLDEGTLADWLARRPRPWRDVLEVFVQAGRGLAAAHAHGLVHRDFKPQNVLVGRDGRVRITDFGLVRPSGPPVRPDELTRPFLALPVGERPADRLTRIGALIGTPRYMAPEQLAGEEVDARADQFSFCAALYEAVYGTMPFQPAGPASLRGAIAEGRFNRPAPGRRVPEWLRRVLVRGLGATPGSRFSSMDALLDAFSGGRERALRREAAAVVASVIVVTVVGASAVLVHRTRACEGGVLPSDQAWAPERREAARRAFERAGAPAAAQAFERAANGLDAYAAAWTAAQTEACVATRRRGEQPESVMAARMACLDRRLLDMDALARLLGTADAQMVRESARAINALRPPSLCLSAGHPSEEAARPASPEVARQLLEARRGLAEARGLLTSGKFADAEAAAARASESARAAKDRESAAEAEGLKGQAQLRAGRWLDAEGTLLEGEILAEQVHREDLAAELSTALSRAYLAQARRKEAQLWADHAEAALQMMPGGDDVVEAGVMEQQARLASAAGHWEKAIAPLRRALELKQRALGPSHPAVAETMLALAKEMKGSDQLSDALAEAEGALEILQKAYSMEHPELARAWQALGQIHRDRGEFNQELTYARRILALQEQQAAPGSVELARAHQGVAIALDNLGDHEGALVETRAALAGYEAFYGERKERQEDVASLLLDIGFQKYELGADAEALAYFQRSLPIHERALGAADPKMVHPYNAMGMALAGLGRAAEADAYFQRALEAARRLEGENYDLFFVYLGQGRAFYERGKVSESRERLERALELRQRVAPKGSTVLALVEGDLARAELADGQVEAARARADRAVEVVKRVLGQNQQLATPLTVAGEARRRLGDAAGALPILEQAVALCEKYRYRPLVEAEARLALAAVLRELHREPARAQALAAAARAEASRAGVRAVGAPRVDR